MWVKIQRTRHLVGTFNNPDMRYAKTARVMTIFVVAYLAQWWPSILLSVWSYIAPPPIVIMLLIVIFANMGGVFNFLAYTFVRKRLINTQ